MPVLCIIPASLRLRKAPCHLLLVVALFFVTNCGFAKGPTPAQIIPLEPLGFQPPLAQFMLAGSAMMTIDFVDSKHLLVTYNAKKLLKRLPDCPPADQDRVVEALLLELPSAKVVARTSWRTHDHGMYLWNLGQGRFMVRIRDELSTFAPMVNLAKGDAFRQEPFIKTDRKIGAVLLSPEADLMILETLDPPKPDEDLSLGSKNSSATPVQINFFRLIDHGGDSIEPHLGGGARSRAAGRIPANSAGYVAILDQGQQHWAFNFQSYGGKIKELAAFDSTCRPSPMLVSGSEFIAFGCHMSHTPQVIGAFNLRGEEMWEQNMTESYVSPTFAYAPSSGRFALSRVLTRSAFVDVDSMSPELYDGQIIVVYQTDNGRQLLRVDAAPIARSGQNFALSPDGMSLALIRANTVEIYSLPPLTPKEREAVQLARTSAPQVDGDPNVTLSSGSQDAVSNDTPPLAPPAPVAPASTGSADTNTGAGADAGTSMAPAAQNASSDAGAEGRSEEGQTRQQTDSAGESAPVGDAPEGRREPPTLYSPGEGPNPNPPQNEPR